VINQDLKQAVAERIYSFVELPKGWHFGEGVGATESAVKLALTVNSLLAIYQPRNVEVFPCIDGGILIHGYKGADVLEIQCESDSKVQLAHERDGDLVREIEFVSIDGIEDYLGDLAWLPISSTSVVMIWITPVLMKVRTMSTSLVARVRSCPVCARS